jgi:predicted alpha/beta hydrolase family esterase
MKNAIILHGLPSKEEFYSKSFVAPGHAHWLPWLQKELLQHDIYAENPTMPVAYNPIYEIWKKAVERCDHIGPDTILVGHSCGGGFWIRYLSEHPEISVGKVVLVAPWLDPTNELKNEFHSDYTIDPTIAARTAGITVFNSTNDHDTIKKSMEILKDKVANIKVVDFENYGHFCKTDMKTDAFPELLEEVLA